MLFFTSKLLLLSIWKPTIQSPGRLFLKTIVAVDSLAS